MGSVGSNTQNKFLDSLTDNKDFRAWVRENLSNPEFKQFGRDNGMEAVEDLWRQKRTQEELKNVHEMSIEDAIAQVREAIPARTHELWFREGNSDIKPKLVNYILANPNTLSAGLNIAYDNYKKEMSITDKKPLDFETWLRTPQTLYRGERGQSTVKSDIFSAFTPNIGVAASFTKSNSGGAVVSDLSTVDMSKIRKIQIRPIDTWGSYQTTVESEYLIPQSKDNKSKRRKK